MAGTNFNQGRISIRCWIHKETPYLTLTGKLWGDFRWYLLENGLRYNGTALYTGRCYNGTWLYYSVMAVKVAYRLEVSNIRRTKFQNLNVSRLVS